MKKILALLFLVGICAPFFSTSVSAQCGNAYPFGSYLYNYVGGIADGAAASTWDTLFYAYNSDAAGVFNDAGAYSAWWLNGFGVWYASGDWGAGPTTGCPPAGFADMTVQVVSYDDALGTAFNPVGYSIFGASFGAAPPSFDFDQITDAAPSFGGPNNCNTIVRPIPLVSVGTVDCSVPPCTADLTWSDLSPGSFGTPGHPNFLWGYNVVYTTMPFAGAPAPDPGTNSGWTITGSPVAYGTGAASVTAPAMGPGSAVYFALQPIAAGMDNSGGGYGPTAYVTGFSGQSSPGLGITAAAIDLLSFGAVSGVGKAVITWETGSEVDTAGFNVYRSANANGIKVKINDALIPAQGGPASGASYEIVDTRVSVNTKYFYTLEEVETDNDHNVYGPVSVTITGMISPKLSK